AYKFTIHPHAGRQLQETILVEIRFDFIRGDDPRPQRHGKVFTFAWAQIDRHFTSLNVTSRPVIHHGVPEDIICRLCWGEILAIEWLCRIWCTNDGGDLQLKVQALSMRRTDSVSSCTNSVRIREVERWQFIPFSCNMRGAVRCCCHTFHVLFKCHKVATCCRGQGRQQPP